MGGVLQYKWEVYCWASLSSKLRSQEGPAIQMGAYCRTNWRCTAVLSSRPVAVGNENSAQSFSDRSFWKSLRVVNVRAFGTWMSAPTCLFIQDWTTLTEVFGRDIRANDPRMSAGCPSPKLLLWANFFRSLPSDTKALRKEFPESYFRNFGGIFCSRNVQEIKTFSRNHA